jgi:hypothetical protein
MKAVVRPDYHVWRFEFMMDLAFRIQLCRCDECRNVLLPSKYAELCETLVLWVSTIPRVSHWAPAS